MSNYLGALDFIPQLQPFQPNLNLYANVLQTKQNQYDQGLKQFNSIYGSVFNSPMLAQDNIEKRENYFKTITQDVKKVAGLDLSIDQNQTLAKSLFDPILNDKDIVNDILFTKKIGNSYQTHEQYKNCIDPERCGGEAWDEGVRALDYRVEEFKNASPEERLRMQAPSYTPYQNVTKKALAASKAAGFNTSYEYVDGRYDVTDTNGYLLLDRKNKDGSVSKGVLPQYLYGLLGNDQKVQDMYTTQAYVQRKNASKQLAQQHGISEDQGEAMYLNSIMTQVVPKLTKARQDLEHLRSQVDTDQKALQNIAKDQGSVAGDGIHEAFLKLQDVKDKTENSQIYHDQVSNIISNAPKQSDIKALRNRVDSIVANASFMDTVDRASYDYAMATAKHEVKADPYKLAEYNNNLDLGKAITLRNIDDQIWKEHQTLLGKIGNAQGQDLWQAAMSKGITPDELAQEGIDRTNIGTPQSRVTLLKKGILTGDQSKNSEPFLAAGDNTLDTYDENNKIFSKAVDNASGLSNAFTVDTLKGMAQAYRQSSNIADPQKGKVIQDKVLADATNMLKGTGIDPLSILLGTQSPNIILDHPKLGQMTTYAVEARKRDRSAQIYNSNWDDNNFMKVQLADQTMKGLFKQRNITIKDAVTKVLQDIPFEGDESKFNKEGAAYAAMIGKNGLVSPNQALLNYSKIASKYYGGGASEAIADFSKKYFDYRAKLVSKMDSFSGKPGSTNEGGALAQNRIITQDVSGNSKFSQDFLNLKSIASDIVLNKQGILTAANSNEVLGLDQTPLSSELGNKVLGKILNGDTKDMKINVQKQYVPQTNQVATKITIDDETARKLGGLKHTDIPTEDQKTFVALLPENAKSTTSYINQITPSPEDVLLRNDGQVLSVNLATKGNMSIANNGGKLILNASIPFFDEISGNYLFRDIPQTPLSDVSVNTALAIGKSKLDAAYNIASIKKAEYLKNQKQNARTR